MRPPIISSSILPQLLGAAGWTVGHTYKQNKCILAQRAYNLNVRRKTSDEYRQIIAYKQTKKQNLAT